MPSLGACQLGATYPRPRYLLKQRWPEDWSGEKPAHGPLEIFVEVSQIKNERIYDALGIQLYLLRKCLGYDLLYFGGLSTFSDSVWIHRASFDFYL